MRYLLLILILSVGVRIAQAQDFHLSQYDATPHYFNPAVTGMYMGEKGDYRIFGDYRSQWKSITSKPYSTCFLAYDQPLDRYGVGGYIINNRSGVGNYNTFMFMAGGAYKIIEEYDNPHVLNVGLQLGIIYKKFNPNAFTFENQYVNATGEFDQNLSSGENFDKTSIVRFDASMGVFYKWRNPEWNAHPFAGFGLYNLNMPKESFMGTKDRTPMRWVLQGGADWRINQKLEVRPMLLYMNQRRAHELNIGALGFYRLKDTEYSVVFGADYRWKDAVVLQAGIKQNDHVFRISYDINTSYLRNFTNYRGAIEFSLILTGIKGQPLIKVKSRI